MKALIDGDILPYECGNLRKHEPKKDEEDISPETKTGELLPFEICWGAVQSKIEHMISETKADDYCIYLSSREYPTWRYGIATIQPYKGKREHKEKPPYWDLIRDNLQLHYKCKIAVFLEADDEMSIEQYADIEIAKNIAYDNGHPLDWQQYCQTVICSRDKDLDMVPSLHFKWGIGGRKDEYFFQSEIDGLRCFYKQLLTGDTVDNVLGLYGVGEKSTHIRNLFSIKDEGGLFRFVLERYTERFGNYARQFLTETGQLLWMQRERNERWDPWADGRAEEWLNAD